MKFTACLPILAALSLPAIATDSTWLDLGLGRSRDSLALATGVLKVIPLDVVTDSVDHLVLGKGALQIPSFRQPTGPWYAVVRFRVDSYGDLESWNISSLLNTTSWPYSEDETLPLQGFELRLGGGRFYPQMQRNAKVSDAEYVAGLTYFTQDRNASLSSCLLSLVQATRDPVVNWKESFSDRCVEPGVWHQVAAGWDGRTQLLFLDGVQILDRDRVLGEGLAPRLDSTADLFIGLRRVTTYDLRHFHGAIQSAIIRSGILDSALAATLYRTTQPAVSGSCAAIPVIDYPLTLQLVLPTDSVQISLAPSPKCAPGEVADLSFHPGDALDVLALTPDEQGKVLGSARVGSLRFPISALGIQMDSSQGFRLKARISRKTNSVAGRIMASSDSAAWGGDRPMVVVSGVLAVGERARRDGRAILLGDDRARFPGAHELVARSADGRQFHLATPARIQDDTWDLSRLPRGFWILSGAGQSLPFARF